MHLQYVSSRWQRAVLSKLFQHDSQLSQTRRSSDKAAHSSYWNPNHCAKPKWSISSSSSMHRKQWLSHLIKLVVQYGHSVGWWWWLIQFVVLFWIPSSNRAVNLWGETTSYKLISGLCLSAYPGWSLFLHLFLNEHTGVNTRWPLIMLNQGLNKTPLKSSDLKEMAPGQLTVRRRWAGLMLLTWYSSIYSLTPEAWLVCCRELRLLPNTMSEHMQLSLAFCRIGLYTVRKYLWAATVFCETAAGILCCSNVCWV